MAYRGDPQTSIALIVMATVVIMGLSWMVLRKTSSLNATTVQIIGLIILLPIILLLTTLTNLNSHILATLLGGLVGFIFAKSDNGKN